MFPAILAYTQACGWGCLADDILAGLKLIFDNPALMFIVIVCCIIGAISFAGIIIIYSKVWRGG